MKRNLRRGAAGVVLAVWVLIGVGGMQAQDFRSVRVYPNPFQTRLGHTVVTFDHLTPTATLRIFKLTGELVFEKDVTTAAGVATWNTTNNDGQPLASGVYLYVVTGSGAKKTGKIVILR